MLFQRALFLFETAYKRGISAPSNKISKIEKQVKPLKYHNVRDDLNAEIRKIQNKLLIFKNHESGGQKSFLILVFQK